MIEPQRRKTLCALCVFAVQLASFSAPALERKTGGK